MRVILVAVGYADGLLVRPVQYDRMRSGRIEVAARSARKLRQISADLQSSRGQKLAVAPGRLHDEISAYLYGVGVVFHSESTGACGIIAAARLNEVSRYGQLVSVEIERPSRQIQIAVDGFIFLERPAGALAVGERYVAAVVYKFNNGCRR